MEITVKSVSANSEELAGLIGRLDEDLLQRYPAEAVFGLDFSDPGINDILFAIAYAQGTPVGCGAIRPVDPLCVELKRFYVDSSYRRLGIARRLLDFLEADARRMQYKAIRLEAGPNQPEALAFYTKHGYREIDRFGEYADCELSLCFEKLLV